MKHVYVSLYHLHNSKVALSHITKYLFNFDKSCSPVHSWTDYFVKRPWIADEESVTSSLVSCTCIQKSELIFQTCFSISSTYCQRVNLDFLFFSRHIWLNRQIACENLTGFLCQTFVSVWTHLNTVICPFNSMPLSWTCVLMLTQMNSSLRRERLCLDPDLLHNCVLLSLPRTVLYTAHFAESYMAHSFCTRASAIAASVTNMGYRVVVLSCSCFTWSHEHSNHTKEYEICGRCKLLVLHKNLLSFWTNITDLLFSLFGWHAVVQGLSIYWQHAWCLTAQFVKKSLFAGL